MEMSFCKVFDHVTSVMKWSPAHPQLFHDDCSTRIGFFLYTCVCNQSAELWTINLIVGEQSSWLWCAFLMLSWGGCMRPNVQDESSHLTKLLLKECFGWKDEVGFAGKIS